MIDERLIYKITWDNQNDEDDKGHFYDYGSSATLEEAKEYFIELFTGSNKFSAKDYGNSYTVTGTLDSHYVDVTIQLEDGEPYIALYVNK